MVIKQGYRVAMLSSLVFISFQLLSEETEASKYCFANKDNSSLIFEVFQQAPVPPTVDSSPMMDYQFYPATSYATPIQKLPNEIPVASGADSKNRFKSYAFIWTNRCYSPTPTEECRNNSKIKGNPYDDAFRTNTGAEVRMLFTTYKRANACTKARVRHALGDSKIALSQLGGNNNIVMAFRDEEDNAPTVLATLFLDPKNKMEIVGDFFFKDVCVIDKGRPTTPIINGIVLDYEPQDARTPLETLSFIKNIKYNVTLPKNVELIVYTNPLGSAGGLRNGINNTNANEISLIADALAPVVWSGAKPENNTPRRFAPLNNFLNQWRILSDYGRIIPAADRLIMGVSLYDLDTVDALALHNEINKKGLKGVWLWQNGAKQNGNCESPTKKAISCLIFGQKKDGTLDCSISLLY